MYFLANKPQTISFSLILLLVAFLRAFVRGLAFRGLIGGCFCAHFCVHLFVSVFSEFLAFIALVVEWCGLRHFCTLSDHYFSIFVIVWLVIIVIGV
jgi:hypothetical protein